LARKSIDLRTLLPLTLAAVLLALGGLWLHFSRFTARTIVEDAYYRSPQPGSDDLRRVAARLGIRSVVNLRGADLDEAWYRDEVATANELGLEHRDFHFPNILSDWPQRSITRELVTYLESAPQPVLIHCMAGADRAGWAAGIVGALAGKPLPEVRRELSPMRGHLCSSPCRFDDFFDQYVAWLDDEQRTHAGAVFREWVFEHYSPGPYLATMELIGAPHRNFLIAGKLVRYRVRVTNRSTTPWTLSPAAPLGIRLGVRMQGPLSVVPQEPASLFRSGRETETDLVRHLPPLPRVVEPGQSWETNVEWELSEVPGSYLLQFDMVDEHVHWFSDLGEAGLILPIQIHPGDPLASPHGPAAHAQK